MKDDNTNELTYEMEMEDDAIMPDGWAEGDDYFDSDSWTGGNAEESATAAEPEDGAEESATENSEEEAPATEPETEEEVEEGTETEEAPATEPVQASARPKFKVKYQFDHKDVEEEIDEEDLPELLQKARSSERYKVRSAQNQQKAEVMAKILGYQTPEEMMDAVLENARNNEREALLSKGNSEEIVDDFLARKYAMDIKEAPTEPEVKPQPEAEKPAAIPFAEQARELLSEFPKLRGTNLPDEVLTASASGQKTLLQAYREFKEKEDAAEINRLRKENQIHRQNAASAARAPVTGVSKGGGANAKPEDDFLRGFNADY